MNDPYSTPRLRPPNATARTPVIVLLGCSGLLVLALLRYGQNSAITSQPAAPRPVAVRGDLDADERATVELFQRCSKSVVYVSPMAVRTRQTFFGIQDTIERGAGSGFVWDKQGHIVTNFHVVYGADAYLVTLADSQSYEAKAVGGWPDKDIAVLKIDAPADKLFPIDVGTSRDLLVGQKVFAIGNPYALDFTLTTGVVSALNREIVSLNNRTIQGVIQTDAAINPGNSGGPLLDSAGRLIGMNTSILSRSGASAGIGFAVPVDTINRVVPQLIAHGKVIRPGLGVNIDDSVSRRLGLDGVLILGVAKGSGAEQAGLKPSTLDNNGRLVLGDIILMIDSTPTPNFDALLNALENHEAGDTVDVTVERDGKKVVVPVTLQAIE